MKTKKTPATKTVDAIKHEEATRKNIPTAEYQSVMNTEDQNPIKVAFERQQRLRPATGVAGKRCNGLE